MRILQVHNTYQYAGGEDAVVAAERELLQGAGHGVSGFTADNASIKSTADYILSALNVIWSRQQYLLLRQKIRENVPDVVHVHNFFPLITPAVFRACVHEGVPAVLTLHNYRITCAAATLLRNGAVCEKCVHGSACWAVVHGCYRGSRWGSASVAAMIAWHKRVGTWRTEVARFVALTEFQRGKLIDGGLPPEKIAVKPNFLPAKAVPKEVKWVGRCGALFVGRLSTEKGLRTLLEAWQSIDYPLTLVGEGPMDSELRANAPPTVSLVGAVSHDQVIQEMQRAAFLVVPSICYETFGLVVIEAFASGLPVVASNLGALGELVVDGKTGRLCAPGDAVDLRRVILELLVRPTQLQAMGQRAVAFFREQYTAAANLDRLEDIYAAASGSMTGYRAPWLEKSCGRPPHQIWNRERS